MKRFEVGTEVRLIQDMFDPIHPLHRGDEGSVFNYKDIQGVRFYRVALNIIWQNSQPVIEFVKPVDVKLRDMELRELIDLGGETDDPAEIAKIRAEIAWREWRT